MLTSPLLRQSPEHAPPVYGLTVRQPWAAAVAQMHMRVLNDAWRPPQGWTGWLLIHAAQDTDPAALVQARTMHPHLNVDVRGAVVAVAHLADHHYAGSSDCCRWGQPRVWHWELDCVRPLRRPVPCCRRQRLWTPGQPILQSVRAQLPHGAVL